MNILFVCTGNTCRSAMAAAIMDKIAVENDLDVFIESAGIFAEDGQGASENAIKALPVVRGRKGEHVKLFEQAKKSGYVRVIADGNMYELTDEIKLEKNKKHNIEIVVDRLSVREGIQKRLTDSIVAQPMTILMPVFYYSTDNIS